MEQSQINKIKEISEEFFAKMAVEISGIEIDSSLDGDKDVVNLNIKLLEPQILIGQQGQTLLEIQRLLRVVLNKKLQKVFYVNLDINDYKKKKIEYLKSLANDSADQVSLTKQEKTLLPMPAYERRIVHSELSKRTDIITESQGEDLDRHIVIKPR